MRNDMDWIWIRRLLPAMMGLQDFLRTIRKIKRRINPKLHVSGILLTMCDSRTDLCRVVSDQVTEAFKDQLKVFETRISNTVKVGEAICYSKAIEQYSPKAGAESFRV